MGSGNSVKIIHGALDEFNEEIILRGVIDPSCLGFIMTDGYQREVISGSSFDGLVKAFQGGKKIPDVVLGMRGQRIREHTADFTYYLQDEVYVVDGLQRISAAIYAIQDKPDTLVRLGATVYFGTTREWERDQFLILNAQRIRVSANVLIRNLKDTHPVIETLYSMSNGDRTCILNDRICWTQRMRRSDVLNVFTVLKTVGWLHSHIGPGRSNKLMELVPNLQNLMEKVGRNIFRENIRTFFEIVDECWGIRNVVYQGSPHLRGTFLGCLAQVFSNHHGIFFSDTNRLTVETDTRRKLKQFPLNDPKVSNLAASGGQGGKILYVLMIDHINRGRRKHRLTEAVEVDLAGEDGDGEEEDEQKQ